MKSDLVDIEGMRHRTTERAILFSETGDKADAVWLPLSLIEIESRGTANHVTVTMPEWLAIDKGLV